jgi:hypothetical protein
VARDRLRTWCYVQGPGEEGCKVAGSL